MNDYWLGVEVAARGDFGSITLLQSEGQFGQIPRLRCAALGMTTQI